MQKGHHLMPVTTLERIKKNTNKFQKRKYKKIARNLRRKDRRERKIARLSGVKER
jgi:hypothetical protein